SLAVINGAVFTHSSGREEGLWLTVATDITIDAESAIDVSGQGYGSRSGPGQGRASSTRFNPVPNNGGTGAGHGGFGGQENRWRDLPAGPAYGDPFFPRTLGS